MRKGRPSDVRRGPYAVLSRHAVLISTGTSMAFALLALLLVSGMRRDSEAFVPMTFVPFSVFMVLALWTYKNQKVRTSKRELKELLILIIGFALIFRAIFLFTTPTISDDIYRFYWDGKVQANGINPYQYAPEDGHLEDLRDDNWKKVNNKDVPSPYPPFSQMTFLACYFSTTSLIGFKAFFTAFDVMSIYVIFQLLRKFGRDPMLALLYGWCPLVVIEFAHSGHNDSLAMFLVLVSFLLMAKGNKLGSAAVLSLAALTKIYPLLFAPLLFRAWGKKGTALFLVMLPLFYLPYITAGGSLFGGLSEYADRWLFNGSVFAVLLWFVQTSGMEPELFPAMWLVKYVMVLTFGLSLAYMVYHSRKQRSDVRTLMGYCFGATCLFLLLTSTVHPWYIVWVVPFLPFFPYISWLVLSGTCLMSYWIYIGYDTKGTWVEELWVKLAEYVPFYILMAYELGRDWGFRKRPGDRSKWTMARRRTGVEEE